MHVRAEVRDHQRFAQEPRAEVRDDDRHLRIAQRECVEIERVAEPDVEMARQPEFLSDAHRQHAAVHEHDGPRPRGGDVENLVHAVVLNRVAVHRGKETDAPQRAAVARHGRRRLGVALRRIEHEEADEPIAMPRDSGSHRRRIAGRARDQHGAADAMPIELRDPAIRECFSGPRRIPSKLRDRRVAAERGEERR